MRVLLATPLYPPESGGPATYSKILEEGLSRYDIEVILVKFSDVRSLPKVLRHAAYFWRLLRASKNVDLIYALDAVSVGLPAMLAARLARKPFAVKIVGDYAWEQGSQRFKVTATLDEFVHLKDIPFPLRIFRFIQSLVARKAKRVVVPSEYLKKLIQVWGIPAEKIEVIYNSISQKEITDARDVMEGILDRPRPLIVTASRLVPWKKIDGIVEAVRRIRSEGSPASLVIIGGGPKDIVLMRAALNIGPDDTWITFTGALDHSLVLGTMAQADIFVLNSSYEGLSHVLIEASLLGIPIVATRVGGNPEVVSDGINGLLIPAGDTNALAAAIKRILNDHVLSSTLRENAKMASERFLDTTMLETTARFLKTIL